MLASACGGSTAVTEVTGPDAVRCQTALSPSPGTFPASGSRVTLTVTAARECTWNASTDASWAQITPTSGQGETTLTVTVAENPDARVRSGAIAVNESRLSLSQEAAPCRFDANPSTIRLSHEAGQTSVNVSATGGCSWRASSGVPWARVLTASGTSSGTVQIEVSSNPGAARSTTLTIADRSVTVEQAGAPSEPGEPPPSPPPSPPAPGCSIALDPPDRSFPSSGGDGTIRVTTQPGCRWSAASNADWIDVNRGNNVGSDTIRYRVSSNGADARTGTILISGQSHTVRQEAAPAPPPNPGGGERVSVSGAAFFVAGSCPNLQFLVNFIRPVVTDGDTNFKGKCSDIRNGTRVKVDGRIESGGRIRATKVDVDEDE